MLNGTITRSPRFKRWTEEPTSSTTPMNSWPKVVPMRVSGIMPWYRCRSEPQIAASVTRTMASFGCSMRGDVLLLHPDLVRAAVDHRAHGCSFRAPGHEAASARLAVEAVRSMDLR